MAALYRKKALTVNNRVLIQYLVKSIEQISIYQMRHFLTVTQIPGWCEVAFFVWGEREEEGTGVL